MGISKSFICSMFVFLLWTGCFQLIFAWPGLGDGIIVSSFSQNTPIIVPDGSGGSMIAWYDNRNKKDRQDIYVQAIDKNGYNKSPVNGVAICTSSGNHEKYHMISVRWICRVQSVILGDRALILQKADFA